MNVVESVGSRALGQWHAACDVSAVAWSSLCLAVNPAYWPRTVRDLFSRQILFTGIEALGLILLVALLTGVSIVAQAQLWLARFGQSEMLGPLLVAVIMRAFGPLLVNFIVIGRSGTAMATELAAMRVRGEVDVLEAQGLDAMAYLVMPRVVSMAVSVFCLTVIFIAGANISGYLFARLVGVTQVDAGAFTNSVLGSVTPGVVLGLLANTMVPGTVTAAICCVEGLSVEGAITSVPQAGTRGVVKSIAALIIVSAVAAVLTNV